MTGCIRARNSARVCAMTIEGLSEKRVRLVMDIDGMENCSITC